MDRTFKPAQLNVKDAPRKSIEIVIAKDQVAEWCLELSLLLHGLIEAIYIKQSNSAQVEVVRASSATHSSRKSRCRQKRSSAVWKPDRVIITLPLYNLEYWLHFSLFQYRDAMPEVDHFDEELTCHITQETEILDLTVRIEP